MDFDKSRVYTTVNADELKVGSKVVCANTMQVLMSRVEFNDITELRDVLPDCYTNRFQAFFNEDLINYNLCYLVSEPEEKKLKWTDLKLGDILREKNGTETRMVTSIDTSNEPDDEGDILHVCLGDWWCCDSELEEWEKVEE